MLLPILRTKTILCFRYVWMFVGLEDTTNTGVDITQSRHLFVSHCYAVNAILFFSMELTFFFWLSFLLNECQPKTAHLLLNEFIHRMGRSQKVWNQQCKHTVVRDILSKDKSRQTQTQNTNHFNNNCSLQIYHENILWLPSVIHLSANDNYKEKMEFERRWSL